MLNDDKLTIMLKNNGPPEESVCEQFVYEYVRQNVKIFNGV